MNENSAGHSSLVETNDSLEAVSVFRGWKNIFFAILLISLLLSQAAFWLVNLKVVEASPAETAAAGSPAAVVTPAATTAEPAGQGAAADTAGKGFFAKLLPRLDYARVARAVELINGILIVTAVLLAASIFFGLMVSLVGRLGGINHISRAFILALIAVVLLVPWQIFGLNVLGVTWTPEELARWLTTKDTDIASRVIFYLRFTGYWAAVLLLLLLSQARSTRWSKAILRRLEII